ncbi:hypothetical protein WME90_01985 [Sorangium sp. So ce375]|uniref:hypothetical protein n=1 Tax=Sorangium sp. So ce375 TaxID=3133306 RepID=UPI003F5CA919
MALFATINGQRILTARLHVPYAGLWFVDVQLDQAVTVAGSAVVTLGRLELRGVVAPARSGAFQDRRRVRVVAGAGGWLRRCSARQMHNTQGVTLRSAVTSLAADVGETFDPTTLSGKLGSSYFIRQAAPASRVLEQLLGSTPWWVDYQGVTRAGARTRVETPEEGCQLLDFNEREKVAELALDDPTAVVVGSVLRGRLERPLLVRELRIEMSKAALRASAVGEELAA